MEIEKWKGYAGAIGFLAMVTVQMVRQERKQ